MSTSLGDSVSVASSERYFGELGVVRSRAMSAVLAALGIFALASLPYAVPGAILAVVVSCAVALVVVAQVLLSLSPRRKRLTDGLMFFALPAAVPVVYHLDLSGPAVGGMSVLLFLYLIDVPRRLGVAATIAAGIPHIAAHGLVAFDLLPKGMLLATVPSRIGALGNVVILYVLGVLLAVVYRSRTGQHLEELARAGQQIAAQDALLREARLDRERVFSAGKPGRFTEQRLGQFTLGTVLGRGGMGEIYEATHVETGERAAVKLVRAASGDAEHVVRRFEREVAIVGALRSPNIAKVLEVGGLEAAFPFIAMERLEGEDCGRILRREGRMLPEQVVQMTGDAALGLLCAKRQNVVHRDIKPSNLFRTTEGPWKVLDFGLGRVAGDSGTLTGNRVVGTFGYLAPEQVSGDTELSHQTDIHALAIVAYRALTGRLAFVEREPAAVMKEVTTALPPAPSRLVGVPKEVDDVLLVALAKDPADRFEDSAQFAEALAAAMRQEIAPGLRARARSLARRLSWSEPTPPKPVAPAPAPTLTGAAQADPPTAATAKDLMPQKAGASEPKPARRSGLIAPKRAEATLAGTPEEVVRYLLMARARGIVFVVAGLGTYGALLVRLNPSSGMRVFGGAAFALLAVEIAFIFRFLRDKTEAGQRRFNLACLAAFCTTPALIYFFSPYGFMGAILPTLMLVFGIGAPPRLHALVVLAVAVPHAAMHLGMTFGWLLDRSPLVVQASTGARLWNLGHALGMYSVCAFISVILNHRSRDALAQLTKTFRQVAEREALLRDARLELERAVGVGQPGRWTGRTVGTMTLGNILGRGGMGEVYEATSGAESYAVKLLQRREGGGRDDVARLEKEGELARRLVSPHVVRVVEVGGTQDVPYVAMERLQGMDLGAVLQRRLVLPPSEVSDLVDQVAEGLAVAHREGVVHRDIKPQNLFLTADGTWKILDFGVAAERSAESGTDLLGTPAYMAPEQLSTRAPVDQRADVYALAVVAYRALTGRPAFSGRDAIAIVNRVLNSMPPPPSTLVPLDPRVDEVVLRAMAKAPSGRFDDALAFATAFREAVARS